MSLLLCASTLLFAAGGPVPEASTAGESLLRSVAAAQEDLRVVRARYTQRRSSPLVLRPLETLGKLVYRRSPGPKEQGVLRLETERMVVRVTEGSYEAWRKADNIVEHAAVSAEGWTDVLFEAMGHQLDVLLERLEVVGVTHAEDGRSVVLRPRAEKDAEKVEEVTVCLQPERPELRSIGYRTAQGETVEIVLDGLEKNPTLPEGATMLGAPETARRIELARR